MAAHHTRAGPERKSADAINIQRAPAREIAPQEPAFATALGYSAISLSPLRITEKDQYFQNSNNRDEH